MHEEFETDSFNKFEFSFDIKTINSEKRIIAGVASVEEVDRDNEIIEMGALRESLPIYMNNPIIRYKHREEIGQAIELDIQGKEFLVTAMIGKGFEPADTVWKKIEQGILKSFSVGGKVRKRESIFNEKLGKEVDKITKMELYEISIVDIPANRNSVFRQIAKSLDKGEKPPSDWMERCKKRVQGKVKNPYAVCTATWQRRKKKMAEADLKEVDEYIESLSKNELGGDDEYKNKREDTMPEELKKQEEEKPEENPEEKQEEPEKKPEEPAPVAPPAEEPKGAKAELKKMYTEKEKDEAVRKAVESRPVRKAALMGETEAKPAQTFKMVAPLTKDEYGDKTFYVDAWKGIDMRKDAGISFKEAYENVLNVQKAVLTSHGGVGTQPVGALIPVYVDPDIIDRTRREIPFIELVPRRATYGLTYDYNAITTTAAAVSLYEDAALADVTDTLDRLSVVVRYMYSVGRVTGPAIAGSRGYIDLLNFEVQQRTIALKRWEDQLAIQDETAPNFSGLQSQISTNSTDLSGPLTISAMRTEITQCLDTGASRASMIILVPNTIADSLRGLLMDYQRYVNTTNIAWGLETMSFDGIPVIVDRYVPSGYMMFIDMSVVHMAVLQDMVYEELAKTNDSIKFVLKMYECLVCRAQAFCSELYNVT